MRPQIADLEPTEELSKAGFRFGDKGTHTSRTIMLSELSDLLATEPIDAERTEYASAIIDDNILGKQTMATRRLTNQRLGELYGLNRRLPLFRTLRRLWAIDEDGRPLMALLCALARDPLLRSTAKSVLDLPVGAELVRASVLSGIRDAVGSRLNDSILDKVARNAGSSWSQSGHLKGRVRKIRQRVTPTPGAVALALWMGGGSKGSQGGNCSPADGPGFSIGLRRAWSNLSCKQNNWAWCMPESGVALLKSMPAASARWRGEPRQWDELKNWRRYMKDTSVRHGNEQSRARNAS